MSKLSKNASDRLLNLLYTTTSTEISTKVPIVTKYLYQHSLNNEKPQSILDDLMENEWKQKPIKEAMMDLPSISLTQKKSNILKFNCQNLYFTSNDFYNIYPINRERKYYLTDELRKGIKFTVVKSRNPLNLLHNGSYYLVFPNYNHACVYWLETLGKSINGFNLNLEFIEPNSQELKFMSSPYLDDSINEHIHYKSNPYIMNDINKTPISDIFKYSKSKSSIIEQLAHLEKDRKVKEYHNLEQDPTYEFLVKLIDNKSRRRCVLVRNLPFGLSKFALPKLLWDYDLATLPNFSNCFTTIINDPTRQISLKLLRFADNENAKRFVRNFHGKKWETVQTEKEKKLYEPILCEVID